MRTADLASLPERTMRLRSLACSALAACTLLAPLHSAPESAPLAWKKLASGCPSRFAFAAAADADGQHVFVHSGETKREGAFDVYSDLWEYSVAEDTWKELKPNGPKPAERAYHSAAYDSKRAVVWIFGGARRDFSALDELWRYDVAKNAWSEVKPSGPRPSARFDAALVHDAKRDRLVLTGGCTKFFAPDNAASDLWTFDCASGQWTKSAVPAPARWQAAYAFAPELDVLLVHGGFDGNSVVQAGTWTWNAATDAWTDLGKGFAATDAHQCVWDPRAKAFLAYGGATAAKKGLDALWSLDPTKPKWKRVAWKGADPGTRGYHAALWLASKSALWVFGGTRNQFDSDLATDEAWLLPLHG